jgi:hypothetical protein
VNERLLQYIWQFQLFNSNELTTLNGESLRIVYAGKFNTDQGPDFSDARIRINETLWAGSIELHIKTSDWEKHKHSSDSNYENVILHVVWENDLDEPSVLPLIELSGTVSRILLDRYEYLMKDVGFIPCENMIHTVNDLTWASWKERLLAERLERKSKQAGTLLIEKKFHWEEVFWILLAKNFGIRVNTEAFEAIARSIPLSILAKHKNQIHQIEALLFGQAGLLDNKLTEDYPRMLQKEYQFLRKKYGIRPIHLPLFFLRMRPQNFPTIRLAQLAALIHDSAHLFSRIKEAAFVTDVHQWFDIVANDYWHYHYRFDEISSFRIKKIGSSMIDNLVINTMAPMLFAYGLHYGLPVFQQKAIEWLEDTEQETNSVINGFNKLNISINNSFDTQALLELKNEYCDKRRCLECAIGNSILKPSIAENKKTNNV